MVRKNQDLMTLDNHYFLIQLYKMPVALIHIMKILKISILNHLISKISLNINNIAYQILKNKNKEIILKLINQMINNKQKKVIVIRMKFQK